MEIPLFVWILCICCVNKLIETSGCRVVRDVGDCCCLNLTEIPKNIQKEIIDLDLSKNRLQALDDVSFKLLVNLQKLNLENNFITKISDGAFNGTPALENLYLSNNKLQAIDNVSFRPLMSLRRLRLDNNLITNISNGAFNGTPSLLNLNLNGNSIVTIKSLVFSKLNKLQELKLRLNNISVLMDAAFFGLSSMKVLRLDNNNITEVSKNWLFGLSSLHKLYLGHNKIHSIEEGGWDYCRHLVFLDLSHNQLREVSHVTFQHLTNLTILKLERNMISTILEGTFNSTPTLKHLYLNNNAIARIIDDAMGGFIGLHNLLKLDLAVNKITSINRNSFLGLDKLVELNLIGNSIQTIEEKAFTNFQLKTLHMNTSSLICNCALAWLPAWLNKTRIQLSSVHCAYPEDLIGQSLISIPSQKFHCSANNSSKPVIKEGPRSVNAISGSRIEFICSAYSPSDPFMNFKWRRNNHDIAPVLYKTINDTSIFSIPHVTINESGKYQCVVSNRFGTAYSYRANLTVTVLPIMTKKPRNMTVKPGSTAKLECAAVGEPTPQISWQKDGGTEFPAAHERRMHPTDDGFFIINTKHADSGLYSCIAYNSAGTIIANATLSVFEPPSFVKKLENKVSDIGESVVLECMSSGWPEPKRRWLKDGIPLTSSYRHFLTAHDQLLVIMDVKVSDSGVYECEIINHLGTGKDKSHLTVKNGDFQGTSDDITGVIIITVVCCAVGTSAVWVIIIYQTQKYLRRDERIKGLVGNGLHLDNKSEHSTSSKDSGTGDSTKRSNDDLHVDQNGCSSNLEGELRRAVIEVHIPLLNTLSHSQEDSGQEVNSCHSTSATEITRSNHDRCHEV